MLESIKVQERKCKVVAVEPEASQTLRKRVKLHLTRFRESSAGFVPETLNIYDEIIPVTNEDAFETGRLIGHKQGVLVGISSGAALWAAIEA